MSICFAVFTSQACDCFAKHFYRGGGRGGGALGVSRSETPKGVWGKVRSTFSQMQDESPIIPSASRRKGSGGGPPPATLPSKSEVREARRRVREGETGDAGVNPRARQAKAHTRRAPRHGVTPLPLRGTIHGECLTTSDSCLLRSTLETGVGACRRASAAGRTARGEESGRTAERIRAGRRPRRRPEAAWRRPPFRSEANHVPPGRREVPSPLRTPRADGLATASRSPFLRGGGKAPTRCRCCPWALRRPRPWRHSRRPGRWR